MLVLDGLLRQTVQCMLCLPSVSNTIDLASLTINNLNG